MPQDLHTTARLAALFSLHHQEIMDVWQSQAAELLRELHLDQARITDHLPQLVTEIISDLTRCGEDRRPDPLPLNNPPVHGVQRFHDGLDVGEVVAEYNLLRIAFNTVAEKHGLFVGVDAVRIINHRIDDAVRMAVMAFAAQQALIRKEQEDEHLAFIAHDLRTPLYAVSLVVESLKLDLSAPALAECGEHFEMLARNLRRLETLVESVLNARALPSGVGTSFRPVLRTFELWPVVQRLIFDLRSVSSKGGIEVVNTIPTALTLHADAALISQVFQNLLGNAFKYAARGRVTVSAREEGGQIVCSVQDNGAGIPLEMLARVFDKLATDPEKDGTGLGLTIVKQIIEAHGGTVTAESEHGAGATFQFTLPLAPAG